MRPKPLNVSKPRIATAVLTRGYSLKNFNKYCLIIRRNRSIVRTLVVQSQGVRINHYVFHEGDIGAVARMVISFASWPLRLRFVNLAEFFRKFKRESNPDNYDKCPETELSSGFSLGYRAMCAFWINEFLTYLGDYDVVFRIDEDCELRTINFDTVLTPMIEGTVDYCAGMAYGLDDPDVTRGLKEFVTDWHEEHPGTRPPVLNCNPYTNLFLLRPQAVKSVPEALAFLQHVRLSGCVLTNRWGDLPIWGALLSMYGDAIKSNLAAEVSYFHGAQVVHGLQG